MKKNNMMRIASVLLVAVLLTSCVIAGTFAKYVSTASGEDQARVAYWGFGEANDLVIDGLFAETYTGVEVKSAGEKAATIITTEGDIIAPGTTNSADFAFAYTNYKTDAITAPEVAYTFDINVDDSEIDPSIVDNTNILWALDATTDADYGTFAELLEAIEDLELNVDGTNTYGPGQLPAAFGVGSTHTISWKWVFENDTTVDADTNGIDDQDDKDTAMGNADTLAGVKIVIKVTATQIDTLAALPVAP